MHSSLLLTALALVSTTSCAGFIVEAASTPVNAVAAAASPQFVKQCLQGKSPGAGKLIQVYCTTPQDFAEYIINDPKGKLTVISNCQFNGCGNIRARTPVHFSNVFFNQSTYGGKNSLGGGGGGGAVTVEGTSASFDHVEFLKCKAHHGGAVYVTGVSGSVQMSNINATGNVASSQTANGGGFLMADSGKSVFISNGFFANNNAFQGGSFFISNTSTLNMTDCNFFNGSTAAHNGLGFGGDIYVSNGKLSWIRGSSLGSSHPIDLNASFDQPGLQCRLGGSIYIEGFSNATVRNVHFHGQRVGSSGGVASVEPNSMLTMDSITASDIIVMASGSLFQNFFGKVVVTNTNIQNTVAGLFGGVYNQYSGHLTMTNVTSFNSTAFNGGGGFGMDDSGSQSHLDNVKVSQSKSLSSKGLFAAGGALYTEGSLTITNSLFDGCSSIAGGVIAALRGSNVTVISTVMKNSTAVQVGGGIICDNCTLSVGNGSFLQTSAVMIAGGAIMIASSANATVRNSRFIGSIAYSGGAICMTGSELIISDTLFDHCSSTVDGGGSIFATYTGLSLTSSSGLPNISLINTVMSNGFSGSSGGAMHIENTILSVINGSFINNTATGAGGALSLMSNAPKVVPITFTGSAVFLHNRVINADKFNHGGAIEMSFFANVLFNTVNLTMVGNQAIQGSSIFNGDLHDPAVNSTTNFGNLRYKPASKNAVLNIKGDVYYEQANYLAWVKAGNNPFKGTQCQSSNDSHVWGAYCKK